MAAAGQAVHGLLDRTLGEDERTWGKRHLNLTIKTVSRPKDSSGFVVLPRSWVVERSPARIMHARRHARDYERLVQHSETLITWVAITLMTRRLTRGSRKSLGAVLIAAENVTG
ncbi:hypothetical protein GCM10010381_00910 [Streptomyces xantholiticus]|nr:hypothetical protein GCM10010381_00910 [Streptomyces xantholiticus]